MTIDPLNDASVPTQAAPADWGAVVAEGEALGDLEGYRVLGLLKRGGQAAVYRALQLSTGREVALKILPAERRESDVERRRFEREMDLVSMFDHPNVVALLDRGVARGRPWFAMRLVEGDDLDHWVQREQPSLRRKLELFLACCEGVAHAHARGVIHRDLKPRNIRVDREGRPHVLDFGLGKSFEGMSAPSGSLTIDGHFVGTLAHAAPEQLSGDGRQADVRTDVHALGLILYWLLTGQDAQPPSGSVAEIVERVRSAEPVPPRRLDRSIDRDLDTIALKALAKDPRRRYQTVQAFADDVARAMRGEVISARRDSAAYVLRKLAARHRLAVAALLALLAVLAASIALLKRERDDARAARLVAESESARARAEADTSERLSRMLAGVLDIPPDKARPGDVKVVELLDRARVEQLPPLAGDRLVRGRVALALARSYASLGRWQDVSTLAESFEPLMDMPTAPVRDRLDAIQMKSRVVHAMEGGTLALPWIERVAQLAREHDAELPPKYLPASLGRLAGALLENGRAHEARSLLDQAMRLAEVRLPEDRLFRAQLLVRRAWVEEAEGRLEDVRRTNDEVLRLYAEHYGGPNGMSANHLADMALRAFNVGRAEEAEALARQAIEIFAGVHDAPHAQVANAHGIYASALAARGKYPEAIVNHRRGLAMLKETAGGSRTYGVMLEAMAETLAASGDRRAELETLREALAWQRLHGAPEGVKRIEELLASARSRP